MEAMEKPAAWQSGRGERNGSSIAIDCTALSELSGRSQAREPAAARTLPMFPVLADRGRREKQRELSAMSGSVVVTVSI